MEENQNQIPTQPEAELPVYRYKTPASQQPPVYGGYTYQNPHPYQPVENVRYQAPKKKNVGVIVAASVAGGIMFLCCLAMAVAMILGLTNVDGKGEGGMFDSILPEQNEQEKTPSGDSKGENKQETPVYTVPDMVAGQKEGEELSLVEINKKVKGSVVAVLIASGQQEAEFSGSGFVIGEDGYIITNEHVINGASSIKIVLHDGVTEYAATVVGADERSDLAVLKVEATGLAPVELGDSSLLEVGETVVAIGNPYGMELAGTMTNGIISALNRKIEMNGSYMTLIQTNASINPGNSGGPLVNAYGQVIGITSSKLVATGYEGIGFAIPINHVVEITEELITHGKVATRAYIGISGRDFTAAEAAQYNMPQGVLVAAVDPECDAAAKGLQKGDILVGFNGEKIASMAELNEKKDQFKPGDTVSLTYWRNNKEATIQIVLTVSSD